MFLGVMFIMGLVVLCIALDIQAQEEYERQLLNRAAELNEAGVPCEVVYFM